MSGSEILVVGAGAIGGSTAGALIRAGRRVTLVDQWFQNVERIRQHGLDVVQGDEAYTVRARAIYLDELEDLGSVARIVLLACKSYDTASLVRTIAPHLASDGYIVSLQNGINEDHIATLVGSERTVGCVVHFAAAMLEPAVAIQYSPRTWLSYTIGELDGSRGDRIEEVAHLLGDAGRVSITTSIYGALWAKLILNCMVNPLTAMSGRSARALWEDDAAIAVMARMAAEAVKVSGAQGRVAHALELPGCGRELSPELLARAGSADDDAFAQVRAALRLEADARAGKRDNLSSMEQDVIRRRRTEIDHLNGYVVREGRRLGVATPVNERVVQLLTQVLVGERKRTVRNLDEVAALRV